MFMRAFENEKRLGMISPILLTGKGCKENMWLYAVKQGALAPSTVINNRREALFQV